MCKISDALPQFNVIKDFLTLVFFLLLRSHSTHSIKKRILLKSFKSFHLKRYTMSDTASVLSIPFIFEIGVILLHNAIISMSKAGL